MRVFRWRKKAVIVLAMCVTGLWALVSWFTADFSCSHAESLQLLHQLCEDYHDGLIDGSLCSDLCDRKTITFQKCTNYKDGKKTLIAKQKEELIILKAKKARWSDLDPIEVVDIFPSMKDFMKMIRESIEFTLGIPIKDFQKFPHEDDVALLSELWSMDVQHFLKGPSGTGDQTDSRTKALMRSIWALMQQSEYVMMLFLRGRPHIPKVGGTCGHFYQMEYLPHGEALESTLLEVTGLTREVPWRARLRVTLSLLEALKSYDEELRETLHLCDVKSENFGVSAGGTVKLLDLDTVFFTSRLKRELSSDMCSSHADCSFFDCEGWCNLTTGKCTEHRINNNLQVICKKMLSSQMSNKYLSLLRGAPYDIEEQLTALVNDCSEPLATSSATPIDPLTQHHAPVRLLDRIYNLLQKNLVYNSINS